MNPIFGLAGIIGGGLRMISPWAPQWLKQDALEAFYIAIDFGLILGLIGLFLLYAPRINNAGTLGFIIAICGLSFIAGPDARIFGESAYQLGSPVIGAGIALLSLVMLIGSIGPKAGPIALLISVGLGVASMLGYGPSQLYVLSGIIFGLGFLLNGVHVFKRA